MRKLITVILAGVLAAVLVFSIRNLYLQAEQRGCERGILSELMKQYGPPPPSLVGKINQKIFEICIEDLK